MLSEKCLIELGVARWSKTWLMFSILCLYTQGFSKQGKYRFADEEFAAQTDKVTCTRPRSQLVAGLGREACWSDSLLL